MAPLSFSKDAFQQFRLEALLRGSWVVISGVRSRVTVVITQFWDLYMTPFTTIPQPPSSGCQKMRKESIGFIVSRAYRFRVLECEG